MVSIFNFTKSREFLRAYIEALPKKGWGEIQRWADHLSLQASYVSQVLAGSKSFNIDQGYLLAKHLGLSENEIEYFLLILEIEKAGSHETKTYLEKRLGVLKTKSKNLSKRMPKDREFTDSEKSVFYSSWTYSAIRLYCSIGKGKSKEEIAKRFHLERAEVTEMLEFLCACGLCEEKHGVYKVGFQKTYLEHTSPHIHRHRLNWRVKALSQIENVQDEEMCFSSPFSVSQEDFGQLREELAKFLERFFQRIQKTTPEEMGVLNIDLLKLR